MPITIPNFTTTAVITGNTLISQADEQFNIMMNDIKTYIQNVYGSVSSSLENEVSVALMQVEDIYDKFNDIYLGAKATDPILDNDGNALIIGAMYFNSTSGILKTYSGSGWITQLTLDVYTKSEVQNSLPSIGLNTTLNNTPNIGQITWNQDDFTANLGMPFGVVQQIGEEFFFPVKNQTGSTILNGRPVMAIGTTGNSGNLLISYHNGLQAYAKNTIGVATHDIPNGANGLITVIGRVRNLDTTGSAFGETWADNDVLYIKPNSNGLLTNVEPQDTQLKMPIANVIHAHTNGTLLVRTTPIDENHDKALIDSKVAGNPDITAGTATKVTYDAKGLITSGTNPTTISGYGITDAYTKIEEDTKLSAMTKAQFNALAEERKANRAGSGFDEWGKHYVDTVGKPNVNDGMWTGNTYANSFLLGAGTINAGISKTKEPIVTVNGYKINFFGVNYGSTDRINEILLPTAPTIYPPTTVLTAEQIASGVIKHADASNSGLIINGKFDTDTSGWVAGGSTISLVDNAIQVTNAVGYGYATQSIPTIVGKKYVAECNVISGTAVSGVLFVGTTAGTNNIISKSAVSGYISVAFVATTTTTYISVLNGELTVGKTKIYDNIAVYPYDAISRSDLVFLESWHEDISEKNFVYPLGNVQYLGGNSDGLTGIANGAFTGFETYSLFGNWQTPSSLIGKGYIWSTLSESNKKAFLANPENNCYLDGDKVIQVRYRLRVIIGEDTNSMAKATVQGKAVIPSSVVFASPTTTVDAGLYSNTSATYTYAGTSTNAISIANVHRRNQGAYHPVYNPNGTKKTVDGNFWYNTTISFNSISDCFDPAKLLTNSGSIASGVSGRPD